MSFDESQQRLQRAVGDRAMLVGGDSIDDVAVLRAGATAQLFDNTRAPSTVGSWPRAHKCPNVGQPDAVSRELLARRWVAGAGPADLTGR